MNASPYGKRLRWSMNKVLLILVGVIALASEIWRCCWMDWDFHWLMAALGLAFVAAGLTLANPWRFSWAGRIGAFLLSGMIGRTFLEDLLTLPGNAALDWGQVLACSLFSAVGMAYGIFGSHPRVIGSVTLMGGGDDFWGDDFDWD